MQEEKSEENINWDQCGKVNRTVNDIISGLHIKDTENNIPELKLFHNSKFNDALAYSKLGKLHPRTEFDNKQHVFCSYGKCWYQPQSANDKSLYDLPLTFVFDTDTLLNKALRAIVFDGGFVHKLHNRKSVFSFLNGFDYGNFKIDPTTKYANKFIEVLYGSYSNYYNGHGLKFDTDRMILENPNSKFEKFFSNRDSVMNKVAWIVTQTQNGDRHRVSTIEFFFSEIVPKEMNVWEIHIHPRIIEGKDEFLEFKKMINRYGYKATKNVTEYKAETDNKRLILKERTAFDMLTSGCVSEWDAHLKHVNEHYAHSWI